MKTVDLLIARIMSMKDISVSGIFLLRSVTIRRTILIVLLGIALSSTITLVIFQYVSLSSVSNLEQSILVPRMDYLVGIAETEGLSSKLIDLLTVRAPWDATVSLVTESGEVLFPTDERQEDSYGLSDSFLSEEELEAVAANDKTIWLVNIGDKGERVYKAARRINSGELVGHILCLTNITPIVETSLITLVRSLRTSAIISILLLVPLCVLAAVHIARPIYSVKDFALGIVRGDKDPHTEVKDGGEILELATALTTISERIETTRDELASERARALRILNSLDEGIVSVDVNGVINQVNPSVAAAFSYTLGASLEGDVMATFALAARTGEQQSIELPIGDRVWQCKVIPINNRSGFEGAVIVLRDTTESVRLEDTRREYVANVSHELRSPLTALRCLIEPLRDGLVTSDDAKYGIYNTLLHETMRLSRLVDDMLELSRLQSGITPIKLEPFDLGAALRASFEMARSRVSDSGIIMRLELPELPLCVGSVDRTEQVLTILLDNAIKFTGDDGVITLAALDNGNGKVHVSVSDNGQGIAERDLPNVFDRFYKADKSRGSSGTGLGLAIAREIVERMGENISVMNSASGGAVFMFTVGVAR